MLNQYMMGKGGFDFALLDLGDWVCTDLKRGFGNT